MALTVLVAVSALIIAIIGCAIAKPISNGRLSRSCSPVSASRRLRRRASLKREIGGRSSPPGHVQ